jgi:hypothetical protein
MSERLPGFASRACSAAVRRAWRALAALAVLLVTRGALAQSVPVADRALLVLSTATRDDTLTVEAQYTSELRLALDGVAVRTLDAGAPGFARLSLAEQINLVRPQLERGHGFAATWLSAVSPELVLVHMVVLSSGRVLVRMIEGNPRRPGFATDLAMASRELLGTAFLFSTPPPDAPVAQVVATVRDQAAPAVRSAGRDWSLTLRVRAGGGLAGFTGPAVLAGGELGVERRVLAGLSARLFFDARGGPFDAGDPLHPVRTVFVSPGLGASYLWRFGPLRFGPTLDLRATWTNLHVQATPVTTETFSLWSFRADPGVELRVALGSRVELLASGAAGLAPLRKVLTLASSEATLIATPFVAWEASLGVVAHLF